MKGCIVKRGRQYAIVLDLGYQPHPVTGKLQRKQKWIKAGPKRKEADAKLAQLVNAQHQGLLIEPSRVSVGDWLTRWIEALAKSGKVKPASIARYRGVVERFRGAPMAAMPIQHLRPSHLEAHYSTLLETLKAATVHVHHAAIHQALTKAKADRLVPVNVANDVDLPKAPQATDKGIHARAHCWTRDEARAFLAATDKAGPQTAAFYAMALDTGGRLRELAGLRWADVNLDTGRITITQQLAGAWARGEGAPLFVPTKTGKPRTITIAPDTLARLKTHKRAQAEGHMARRTTYQDLGLVFATSTGRPLPVQHLGREYELLVASAGVRRIKFHGLRHTVATLLLQAGEPVQNVAARLGHTKTSMTLDVYAHATDSAKDAPMGAVLYGG